MGELFDFLTNTETVRVQADQFDQTVANCQIQGWKLVSNRDGEAVLKWSGNVGSLGSHLIVGLITAPTMGLGNLLYAGNRKGKTGKRLRIVTIRQQVVETVPPSAPGRGLIDAADENAH